MYFYCKNSKKRIVHTGECHHISKTVMKNIGWFETLQEVYENGYRLCKHCNPLMKKFRNERKKIIRFCNKNALNIDIKDTTISILTPMSEWKITIGKKEKIVLYHKNTFETKNDYLSKVEGYHKQRDILTPSILSYVEYIVRHDLFRKENPIKSNIPVEAATQKTIKKSAKNSKAAQRREKAVQRKRAIANVLNIIDSLNISSVSTPAVAM